MPPARRDRQAASTAAATSLPLSQPSRSGPDPSYETLYEIAEKRGLLNVVSEDNGGGNGNGDAADEEILVGRIADSILWCLSLTMLHVTLDVLVQHQYGMDAAEGLEWRGIGARACRAFVVFFVLFYSFHPHPEPALHLLDPKSLPLVVQRFLPVLHQLMFLGVSVSMGCYLIHITNMYGYLATMKNAPGIGCLWIWSVIELDLKWALPSLAICLGFLKLGGYSYL